ncbi:MAG: polysaccharide biosynthesis/export family protein [Candidatus Polarisedimenticolia bacterium]
MTPSAASSAVLLALLLALAPAAPAAVAAEEAPESPAPAEAPADGEHAVGPEDLLDISVFEIPELTRTVRVSERGTISLPLLGEMHVAGFTAMQVEAFLKGELSRKYVNDPQVSVFVKEHGSKKVSVIGAVGKPGVYEMLGPRTLLQVLSQAGGLTEDAGAELFVIRGGNNGDGARIPVRIADLLTSRDAAVNVPVEPGDVVSVPLDRPIYIYVDGAVKTPGRIEQLSSRPITLLQAIAKVGGTTERANLKAVQILRKGEAGAPTVVQVNLKKLRSGRETDPVLADGDIVVVQETFF